MQAKRVWQNKKTVWNNKQAVWEVDGELKVFDNGWKDATGQLQDYDYKWENVADDAELVIYNSTRPTPIGTQEDGLTAKATFKNGTTKLQEVTVKDGETPAYTGETPTKSATAEYTYTFSGWDPALGPISKNTTYQAQFTETTNTYTITWTDYDDSVIDTTTVAYGEVPTHEDPTREGYNFAGWDPTPAEVTGTATYKATYTEII